MQERLARREEEGTALEARVESLGHELEAEEASGAALEASLAAALSDLATERLI